MQSHNGTGTNYCTDSRFNNPDYYTIQDMKILLDISITFILMWALFYVLLAVVFPYLSDAFINHLFNLEWTIV